MYHIDQQTFMYTFHRHQPRRLLLNMAMTFIGGCSQHFIHTIAFNVLSASKVNRTLQHTLMLTPASIIIKEAKQTII